MSLTQRLRISAIVLAAIQGAVLWVNHGFAPIDVVFPPGTLAELPRAMGDWTGKDRQLDANVIRMIGADDTLERVYRTSSSDQISIYLAAWQDPRFCVPHLPWVCFQFSGWQVAMQKKIEFGNKMSGSAQLFITEQTAERLKVLYWYQRGSILYHDIDAGRLARRKLWGRKRWPPLVKVMMYTADTPGAEQRLAQLAGHVRKWTEQLR